MTPSREKEALPQPRTRHRSSIIIQPTTFKQWHHSVSCLRLLLLKGLFTEAILGCNTMLFEPSIVKIHPLHLSSLHFLRALAQESAGRLQPPASSHRLSRLRQAKADFEDALSVIDQDILLGLFPSPPRPRAWRFQRPRALSARFCTSELTAAELSDIDEEDDDPFVDADSPLGKLRAEIRLRDRLTGFRERLRWHVESVGEFIEETIEAQNARELRLSSMSGLMRGWEDVRARIVRRKREGWKRARFDPDRVQDLCQLALAEL